jgi:hypothetical protein
VSRADTQLRARQPIFELRQLMTERAKQQVIKPEHAVFCHLQPDCHYREGTRAA